MKLNTKEITAVPYKGEFQLITKTQAYWVRLIKGFVDDTAPVLKEFIDKPVTSLLAAMKRKEGEVVVREIIR